MQEFYASVGYPISRLVRKAPNNLGEKEVIRAAEVIFDRLYCYGYHELIKVPRDIFLLADTYEPKKNYAKEQAELRSAALWKEKADFYQNAFKAVTTLLFLILFLIGNYYYG